MPYPVTSRGFVSRRAGMRLAVRWLASCSPAALAAAAVVCASPLPKAAPASPTFSKDVAPILYKLAEPKFIPKGSTLMVIAHYDNSAANRYNPDPSAEVRWGDQTWEEMLIGYF